MTFKENLKTKIYLDGLTAKLLSTVREPPGIRSLDKKLARELIAMTDFEYRRAGSLELYVRPDQEKTTDVLVLDNELPIYHTTVSDVSLRKNPDWKQMFSINNVKKIMNDSDVIVSKGRESIRRLHADAIDRLDLEYTREDLEPLMEDARKGLELGLKEKVQEALVLFSEILGFEPVSLLEVEEIPLMFARPVRNGTVYEHFIFFDYKAVSLALEKGEFSLKKHEDLRRLARIAQNMERADLQGMDVFDFLARAAMDQAQARAALTGRPHVEPLRPGMQP